MASAACVNVISPDNFPAWLTPRIPFSPDCADRDFAKLNIQRKTEHEPKPPAAAEGDPDPEPADGDFEFCLEDPVAMLPADELFSDGKLVPLHVSVLKPTAIAAASTEVCSPDIEERRQRSDISAMDLYLSSPKAPRCSSRWRELLGLKKLSGGAHPKSAAAGAETAAPRRNSSSNVKSFKHFLHRGSSKASDSTSSLNTPLLKDLESDSVVISSRLSLSSSSSSGGHEHEDLPRLSLDSDKPYSIALHKNNAPRMRLVKPRADHHKPATVRVGRSTVRRPALESGGITPKGVTVDSPRMNSSGKVIFQSLERSSSSPSSFNGGPRLKHRGIERSYSAGVRVTPVLNVPVSSLMGSSKSGSVFGFGPLFTSSPQKRDSNGNGACSTRNHSHCHHQQHNSSRSNRLTMMDPRT